MLQTAISALAVPNQFPPTPISSKTIGDYWEPSSHAGSLENKGNLIYQLFVFIQLFFIHLTFFIQLTFFIHLAFFYLAFVTFIPCRELGEQRIALGLQPKKTLNLHFKTKLWKFKISESLIFILLSFSIKKNPDCSRMYKMLWNHHACITYCKRCWCLIVHLHKIMVVSIPASFLYPRTKYQDHFVTMVLQYTWCYNSRLLFFNVSTPALIVIKI